LLLALDVEYGGGDGGRKSPELPAHRTGSLRQLAIAEQSRFMSTGNAQHNSNGDSPFSTDHQEESRSPARPLVAPPNEIRTKTVLRQSSSVRIGNLLIFGFMPAVGFLHRRPYARSAADIRCQVL
jgi:hypothetical protein